MGFLFCYHFGLNQRSSNVLSYVYWTNFCYALIDLLACVPYYSMHVLNKHEGHSKKKKIFALILIKGPRAITGVFEFNFHPRRHPPILAFFMINIVRYSKHSKLDPRKMLNQKRFEIDIKCRPQLSK